MLERLIYLALVILASLALGFFWGWRWKQKKAMKILEEAKKLAPEELTRRVRALENFKQAVKVLCPKIKDGEEKTEIINYLISDPEDIPLAAEEDEDTKTAERELP